MNVSTSLRTENSIANISGAQSNLTGCLSNTCDVCLPSCDDSLAMHQYRKVLSVRMKEVFPERPTMKMSSRQRKVSLLGTERRSN